MKFNAETNESAPKKTLFTRPAPESNGRVDVGVHEETLGVLALVELIHRSGRESMLGAILGASIPAHSRDGLPYYGREFDPPHNLAAVPAHQSWSW